MPLPKQKYDQFCAYEKPVKTGEQGTDPTYGDWEVWKVGMTRNASADNRVSMRVYRKPTPFVILDQNVPLRGWYKPKFTERGIRPRPCFTEALLTQPYGGRCPLNCLMCYINNGVRGYRGAGLSVVDPNYPRKVEKQLKEMNFGWAAYISSFTEPFQPLENIFHNTEAISEIITGYGLPLFYLSRMIPPDWADKYLLRSRYSYMQYSITTSDRTDWVKIHPKAASIDDTLRKIKEQREKGIYISIQVDPVIPGVTTNEQIVTLIHELAKAGANHLIFKFVEAVQSAAPIMIGKVKRMFPERGKIFEDLFCETIGGVRNIRETYRIAAHRLFRAECDRAGVTMSLCFEFKYKRNEAGEVIDKTGINLGREFITGDQCHGQKVPIHLKKNGRFVPWDVCPPGGCLYCEEDTQGKIPCGVPLLGKATALRPSDYKQKFWRVV